MLREFDGCQGKLGELTKSEGIVGEKNLVREKLVIVNLTLVA